MPIEIISKSRVIETVCKTHTFRWEDSEGAGFGFDLEADGRIPANYCEEAAINYYLCLTGQKKDDQGHGVIDKGIETWTQRYREPAIGKCHCGEEISLGNFTNTCDKCGADYNSSGQRLAPREQWGEETGETADQILAYNGGEVDY